MTDLELLTPNEIIKSKRKSISLVIKNNGDFIVRAPIKCKENDITKFIHQKANWIVKKRKEQISNAVTPLTCEKMENLILLGQSYEIVRNKVARVKCYDNQIILPEENSKEYLIRFLKKTAKKYLEERVGLLAQLFHFEYGKITVNSARSCWGSCSQKNNLHFTYKLILCPPDVVDYIVLHELCHTIVKNHSKKFWSLVQRFNPYYKTHENWLKKNRAVIDLI